MTFIKRTKVERVIHAKVNVIDLKKQVMCKSGP